MFFYFLIIFCPLFLSKRATEIKQFMDSSHAIAQNLSEEDAERLQKTIEQDEDVERYGSGIFLGAGKDERFGFSVEVRYADENMAESFNCLPTTGRLPEKKNEVALSSMVLEAMGVTPKIGEEVTLTWEVNPMLKQYKTDTFQRCSNELLVEEQEEIMKGIEDGLTDKKK